MLILQSLEKSKSENPAVNCSIFGKKRRFPMGSGQDKYLAKHNAFFDQLDLVTYEEVCNSASGLVNYSDTLEEK